MSNKDYLKHGDLKKVADSMGENYDYLRQVVRGTRNNKRIEDAIQALSDSRKEEHDRKVQAMVEDTKHEALNDFKKPEA